ncbi:MAG TPA: MBL fold metallo-hydrolase, partial [Acidobacteriota bacterium]|nr:MBL fold metallo-hydrolase [Acidobacteriota bacterium]
MSRAQNREELTAVYKACFVRLGPKTRRLLTRAYECGCVHFGPKHNGGTETPKSLPETDPCEDLGHWPWMVWLYNKVELRHGPIAGHALMPALVEAGAFVCGVDFLLSLSFGLPYDLSPPHLLRLGILQLIWQLGHFKHALNPVAVGVTLSVLPFIAIFAGMNAWIGLPVWMIAAGLFMIFVTMLCLSNYDKMYHAYDKTHLLCEITAWGEEIPAEGDAEDYIKDSHFARLIYDIILLLPLAAGFGAYIFLSFVRFLFREYAFGKRIKFEGVSRERPDRRGPSEISDHDQAMLSGASRGFGTEDRRPMTNDEGHQSLVISLWSEPDSAMLTGVAVMEAEVSVIGRADVSISAFADEAELRQAVPLDELKELLPEIVSRSGLTFNDDYFVYRGVRLQIGDIENAIRKGLAYEYTGMVVLNDDEDFGTFFTDEPKAAAQFAFYPFTGKNRPARNFFSVIFEIDKARSPVWGKKKDEYELFRDVPAEWILRAWIFNPQAMAFVPFLPAEIGQSIEARSGGDVAMLSRDPGVVGGKRKAKWVAGVDDQIIFRTFIGDFQDLILEVSEVCPKEIWARCRYHGNLSFDDPSRGDPFRQFKLGENPRVSLINRWGKAVTVHVDEIDADAHRVVIFLTYPARAPIFTPEEGTIRWSDGAPIDWTKWKYMSVYLNRIALRENPAIEVRRVNGAFPAEERDRIERDSARISLESSPVPQFPGSPERQEKTGALGHWGTGALEKDSAMLVTQGDGVVEASSGIETVVISGETPGSGSSILVKFPNNQAVLFDLGAASRLLSPKNTSRLKNALGSAQLAAAIITHAHVDHSAGAPYFHQSYPDVPIYVLGTTARLLPIMWNDCLRFSGRENSPWTMSRRGCLRTAANLNCCRHDQWYQLNPVMKLKFSDAGHIPGAAAARLRTPFGTIVYSGDVSLSPRLTLRPNGIDAADRPVHILFMDSTNGDLVSENNGNGVHDDLIAAAQPILAQGGSILNPAFPLGRSAEMAALWKLAQEQGRLPGIPVYLDGMALAVADVLKSDPDLPDPLRHLFDGDHAVQRVRDAAHRQKMIEEILEGRTQAIMITGSGMMNGGPVMSYFRAMAHLPKHGLFFVGYQAEGTLGRTILDLSKKHPRGQPFDLEWTDPGYQNGKKGEVRKELYLAMQIVKVGLSGHAYQDQTIRLVTDMNPKITLWVHGDQRAKVKLQRMTAQAQLDSMIPRTGEPVLIDPCDGETEFAQTPAGQEFVHLRSVIHPARTPVLPDLDHRRYREIYGGSPSQTGWLDLIRRMLNEHQGDERAVDETDVEGILISFWRSSIQIGKMRTWLQQAWGRDPYRAWLWLSCAYQWRELLSGASETEETRNHLYHQLLRFFDMADDVRVFDRHLDRIWHSYDEDRSVVLEEMDRLLVQRSLLNEIISIDAKLQVGLKESPCVQAMGQASMASRETVIDRFIRTGIRPEDVVDQDGQHFIPLYETLVFVPGLLSGNVHFVVRRPKYEGNGFDVILKFQPKRYERLFFRRSAVGQPWRVQYAGSVKLDGLKGHQAKLRQLFDERFLTVNDLAGGKKAAVEDRAMLAQAETTVEISVQVHNLEGIHGKPVSSIILLKNVLEKHYNVSFQFRRWDENVYGYTPDSLCGAADGSFIYIKVKGPYRKTFVWLVGQLMASHFGSSYAQELVYSNREADMRIVYERELRRLNGVFEREKARMNGKAMKDTAMLSGASHALGTEDRTCLPVRQGPKTKDQRHRSLVIGLWSESDSAMLGESKTHERPQHSFDITGKEYIKFRRPEYRKPFIDFTVSDALMLAGTIFVAGLLLVHASPIWFVRVVMGLGFIAAGVVVALSGYLFYAKRRFNQKRLNFIQAKNEQAAEDFMRIMGLGQLPFITMKVVTPFPLEGFEKNPLAQPAFASEWEKIRFLLVRKMPAQRIKLPIYHPMFWRWLFHAADFSVKPDMTYASSLEPYLGGALIRYVHQSFMFLFRNIPGNPSDPWQEYEQAGQFYEMVYRLCDIQLGRETTEIYKLKRNLIRQILGNIHTKEFLDNQDASATQLGMPVPTGAPGRAVPSSSRMRSDAAVAETQAQLVRQDEHHINRVKLILEAMLCLIASSSATQENKFFKTLMPLIRGAGKTDVFVMVLEMILVSAAHNQLEMFDDLKVGP